MRDPESLIPISSLCSLTVVAQPRGKPDVNWIFIVYNSTLGGLTEWLRSSPGKRVRCNSPAGSSPVPSAMKPLEFQRFLFWILRTLFSIWEHFLILCPDRSFSAKMVLKCILDRLRVFVHFSILSAFPKIIKLHLLRCGKQEYFLWARNPVFSAIKMYKSRVSDSRAIQPSNRCNIYSLIWVWEQTLPDLRTEYTFLIHSRITHHAL